MYFLKYRHCWAWGYNSWQYTYLGDNKPEKDYIEECIVEPCMREYDYSDKYRGLEHHIIEDPPIEWLEKEISNTANSIKYKQSYLELLDNHIKTYETRRRVR